MTLWAMLLKEMRLRTRRERTILILVLYVLLLGLFTFTTLSQNYSSTFRINQWSSTGYTLYHLLTAVQILLILFITPAFTATAINGEKERKTYEMLICSRLSAFSMVTGKLFAGLSFSLLLIAASIPLFSLIFFLGGVAPLTILQDLLTFVITALLVATLGCFCSTLFPRPAISTAITYLLILLWLATPIMLQYVAVTRGYSTYSTVVVGNTTYVKGGVVMAPSKVQGPGPGPAFITSWNPLTALNDTFFWPYAPPNVFYMNGVQLGWLSNNTTFSPPMTYFAGSGIAIVFFFSLSLCFAKPNLIGRIRIRFKRKKRGRTQEQETSTIITA